ncbi:MAG: hypothetical protein K2O62_05750, partial [Clostridia bacterium]|nr:hypothetical protein [Clostridia bacterium]
MRFNYIGGIGVPKNCRIVYESDCKLFKTVYQTDTVSDKLFFVCTPDLKLKLHFDIADGTFAGLSCDCLELGLLPRTQVKIPYAPDGEVKVGCALKDVVQGCSYFGFVGGAGYDESKKAVHFGAI